MTGRDDVRGTGLVGREAELSRAREAAESRHEASQSLLITGPAGIGKTALVEAALEGLQAEVLYLRGTPLGKHGPFETAINGIATFEQAERFQPVKDQIAEIVANAYASKPTPVEVARSIVRALRTIPRRERAAIVVFEDIHLYDEWTLQSLAFFARQNHLYDQPYLITARSGYQLPNFEGIDQVRLGPLSDGAARTCLSRWSDIVVPLPVAATLNRLGDGNPRVLREIASSLLPAQLEGDVALPVPQLTPPIREVVAETFDALSAEEVSALAIFQVHRDVPIEVADPLIAKDVMASLLDRDLVTALPQALRVRRLLLGWAAWRWLGAPLALELAPRLAAAWADVSPVTAAYYRTLDRPMDEDTYARLDLAFRHGMGQEPRTLIERVAESCCRTFTRATARDGLRWVESALTAEHLGGAMEAWRATGSLARGGPDIVGMVRTRETLGNLTGTPAIGIPSPSELNDIQSLPPPQAFLAWALAARSAARMGALPQSRRYLNKAQELGKAAQPSGRALWRLVDCEYHVAAGTPVAPEAVFEALARWSDDGGGQFWYDDVGAVLGMTDLGEHAAARQLLLTAEAAHNDLRGVGRLCLAAARLHLELAEYEVGEALVTAQTLRRLTVSRLLHAPQLRADLLRLHALTGWTDHPFSTDVPHHDASDKAMSAAKGHHSLIEGNYQRAATLLGAAIAAYRSTPTDRWSLLADVVEAYVGMGDPSTAAAIADAEVLPEPRFHGSAAAAARARALVAPPFDVRNAFAKALHMANAPLPLVYRGRALLAYARRLEHLGSGQEADRLRVEAADLFGQQGLTGWQRHAEQLRLEPSASPGDAARFDGQLSEVEQQVVRLVLAGQRNKQIAGELYVSLRTVEKLLTDIYRRFGVSSKVELLDRLERFKGRRS